MLQRNLLINERASNDRAIQVAVSDRTGKVDLFSVSDFNIGATSTVPLPGSKLVGSVACLLLTQILAPDELTQLRLIKVDVEGAELAIRQHLLEHLSLFPKNMDLIVEVNPDTDKYAWVSMFDQLKERAFLLMR